MSESITEPFSPTGLAMRLRAKEDETGERPTVFHLAALFAECYYVGYRIGKRGDPHPFGGDTEPPSQ